MKAVVKLPAYEVEKFEPSVTTMYTYSGMRAPFLVYDYTTHKIDGPNLPLLRVYGGALQEIRHEVSPYMTTRKEEITAHKPVFDVRFY